MTPSHRNRRAFLESVAASAVGSSALAAAGVGAPPERDPMAVAVIGCGGMGTNHLNLLAKRSDVRIAYVCDVDSKRLAEAIALAKPHEPKPVTDMRRVLDDDAVTAVWIATPDHWHGPATLLSLAAGKHVYVEKPAAHNIREGRLMLDAARSSNRVVQVGTQSRSTAHVKRAVELLRQGAIGEVRGTARNVRISATRHPPIRRESSTLTSGSDPHPNGPINPTSSTRSGAGGARSEPAISATTESTTSISLAGVWALRATPRPSPRSVENSSSMTIRNSPIPCTVPSSTRPSRPEGKSDT
jgi:predicted dehydrogenase